MATQDEARKAIKQRQWAKARAKAAHRRDTGQVEPISLTDMVREQRANRRRAEIRQRAAEANGRKLLAQVNPVLSLALTGYESVAVTAEDDGVHGEANYSGERLWRRDCYDVIAAAKASPVRYQWNRDWREVGRLNIQVAKQQSKAA